MRTLLISLCVILSIRSTNLTATEVTATLWWPQFRGPAARGIAEEDGQYPTSFGPNKNVIWKVAVPSGVSSPCIWDNRIFITAHDKSRNVLETICLDRKDGSIVWRRDAPAERIEDVHEVSSPANATAATDGKRVYVYFASYGLISYTFDGTEVWKTPLPFRPSRFGSGSSPIVVDDIVLLNRDSRTNWKKNERGEWEEAESDSNILAVSAIDGTTVWRANRPASKARYSSPALWAGEQGDQILLMGSNRLTAYDLRTGDQLWWVGDLPSQVCATPQVAGMHVYVTGTGTYGEPEAYVGLPDFKAFLEHHDKDGDNLIGLDEIPDDVAVVDRRASGGAGNTSLQRFAYRLDRNRDQKIEEQEWSQFEKDFGNSLKATPPGVYSIRLGGKGDVTKSHVHWHSEKGVAEVPSLLVLEDRMFLVRNGGIVHCRNLATGEDFYRGRLGPIGGYFASPVAAAGNVYLTSDRGMVTVIAADAPRLTILARNDLQEPVIATPALIDGIVYIRTATQLYAFGS